MQYQRRAGCRFPRTNPVDDGDPVRWTSARSVGGRGRHRGNLFGRQPNSNRSSSPPYRSWPRFQMEDGWLEFGCVCSCLSFSKFRKNCTLYTNGSRVPTDHLRSPPDRPRVRAVAAFLTAPARFCPRVRGSSLRQDRRAWHHGASSGHSRQCSFCQRCGSPWVDTFP